MIYICTLTLSNSRIGIECERQAKEPRTVKPSIHSQELSQKGQEYTTCVLLSSVADKAVETANPFILIEGYYLKLK